MNLIENPALVEHDAFSDTLLAVFHLLEELSSREYLMDLPLPDRKHLANDMKRVYRLIILEWLEYLCHLKDCYPYFFSLALRKNPFDPGGQSGDSLTLCHRVAAKKYIESAISYMLRFI